MRFKNVLERDLWQKRLFIWRAFFIW